MRLDVRHLRRRAAARRSPRAYQRRHAQQSADLVGNEVLDLVELHLEHAPAEARLVVVAWVRADTDAVRRGALENAVRNFERAERRGDGIDRIEGRRLLLRCEVSAPSPRARERRP